MKRNDLQTIMRRAWHLFRSMGKAFAVCLSKAWQLYRMTKRVRESGRYIAKGGGHAARGVGDNQRDGPTGWRSGGQILRR